MGLFKNLMNTIFHAGAVAEAPVWNPKAAPATQPPGTPKPAAAAAPAPTGAAAVAEQVDVAAILDKLAATRSEKLDWRHSIVDLMKVVGMDSSLAERKELATDLKYPGDMNDSAKMNMWLHKEVLRKLADNGGKLPPELLAH